MPSSFTDAALLRNWAGIGSSLFLSLPAVSLPVPQSGVISSDSFVLSFVGSCCHCQFLAPDVVRAVSVPSSQSTSLSRGPLSLLVPHAEQGDYAMTGKLSTLTESVTELFF